MWHWAQRLWRRPKAVTPQVMPVPHAGQLALAFGGHSSVLVRYHNIDIACDPMLGTWLGGVHREVAPGLTEAQLANVAVVVISSIDPFHLHVPTLRLMPRTATIIVPPGGASHVSALRFARVIELADGADFVEGRALIHAARVPRANMPRTNAYVIRANGPTVLFCGDGAYGEVFADIGERFEPDIALLPIGGFRPLALRDNHMSPLDALEAFHDLRARLFIPIRFGAFSLSYEHLDAPMKWLGELVAEDDVAAHVRTLMPGDCELFAAPSGVVSTGIQWEQTERHWPSPLVFEPRTD